MFYVYVLKSNVDGSFYIGQCQNIKERVQRHNKGYTKSTKAKVPWQLVYYEAYKTRREAIKREIHIKRQKSHQYIIDELISQVPKNK